MKERARRKRDRQGTKKMEARLLLLRTYSYAHRSRFWTSGNGGRPLKPNTHHSLNRFMPVAWVPGMAMSLYRKLRPRPSRV